MVYWWSKMCVPVIRCAVGCLLRVGCYMFGLMMGGLVFAYLYDALTIMASFVWSNTNTVPMRPYAWIAGAVISAVGIPLGWVKISYFDRAAKGTISVAAPSNADQKSTEVRGFWPCIGFFALAGFILGVTFAGLLVMSWFSIAASPFAPAGWSQSIHHDAREFGHSIADNSGRGWTSQNPIAVQLLWMPVATLTTLGLAIGIVAGVRDTIHNRKQQVSGNRHDILAQSDVANIGEKLDVTS
jgi:hypothetical protein